MTGIAPTPPASAPAATSGAAPAQRRPPDEAERPLAADAPAPRRGPATHPGASPAPDPEGHRGRLVDVFA